MAITASQLRQDVYRILDEVAATGIPVEILRKGKRLRIAPVEPTSKLANLPPRDALRGDPEDIVHLDWSAEWQP
jgi:antitoxin (DNA-binding transcriptional repressor) of toxin-antitoxin stability system